MSTPEIIVLGTARITSLSRKDKRGFNTSSGSGPKGAAWPVGGPYDVEVIAARGPDGKLNGAIPDGPIPEKGSFPRQISLNHLRALEGRPFLKATFTEGAKLAEPEAQEDVQALMLAELRALREGQEKRDAAHAAEVAALRAEVEALKAKPAPALDTTITVTPAPGLAPEAVDAALQESLSQAAAPAPAAPPAPVKPAAPAKPPAKAAPKPPAKAVPLPSDSPAAPVPSSGTAP